MSVDGMRQTWLDPRSYQGAYVKDYVGFTCVSKVGEENIVYGPKSMTEGNPHHIF